MLKEKRLLVTVKTEETVTSNAVQERKQADIMIILLFSQRK